MLTLLGPVAFTETWLAVAVILVLVVAGVAALYGLVRGGSLDALARTQFRFVWLLFSALLVQVAFDIWDPAWLSETGDLVVLLATNVAVAGFLALNWHLPGMFLAAGGLLLNVLVIALNGGMPVSLEAAEIAGLHDFSAWGIKHEPLGEATILPWIADVIPLPGLKQLLSIGDVVLAGGIAWLVYRRTLAEDPSEEQEPVTPAATSG